jgi:molybdenum cofactor biosynthesis enzyme MoaA
VSFGGGEPTMHPDFVDILSYSIDLGFGVNFTTFGVQWLQNNALLSLIAYNNISIGVSVHNHTHIEKILKIRSFFKTVNSRTKIIAQHVFGSVSEDDTARLIVECQKHQIDILFLGYKHVGFGKDKDVFDIKDFSIMYKLLKSEGTINVQVDTLFAKEHEQFLNTIGASTELYDTLEGKFSMFIDSSKKTIGKSSYDEQKSINDWTEIMDYWRQWND